MRIPEQPLPRDVVETLALPRLRAIGESPEVVARLGARVARAEWIGG